MNRNTYRTGLKLSREGWRKHALVKKSKRLKQVWKNTRLLGRSIVIYWHPLSKLRLSDGTFIYCRELCKNEYIAL